MEARDKICAKCEARVSSNAKFCRFCGSSEFNTQKKCQYCNSALPLRPIKFCPTCGKRVSSEKSSRQRLIVAPEGTIHDCGICRQPIKHDLVFCPSCTHTFHFNHLSSWIVEKSECPICKTALQFAK